MRYLVTAATLLLVAGCGGASSPGPGLVVGTGPPPSPTVTGDLSKARLSALLLQPSDLPDLPQRRVYASADLMTGTTPQLALCRPAPIEVPHAVANVIAGSGKIGMAKVFEVLIAYPDAAAAAKAQANTAATALACPTYQAQGLTYTVQDLSQFTVEPGIPAVQYRLATAGLTDGDVRTVGQKGRFTVFITASGGPHRGQAMLDYQRAVLRTALARLP